MSPWISGAFASLFSLDPARRRLILSGSWPLILCSIVAILVTLDQAAGGGWYESHEYIRYPVLSEHFYLALSSGNWWPRWLPNLRGGYGYPEFVFYQPLFFFVTVPFRALLGDPISACWGAIAFTLTVGSWGSFRLSADGKAPLVGILGAAGFFLFPYVWVDFLVRGDLSELLATALCPWAFYYYLSLVRLEPTSTRRLLTADVRGLAISLALIILAHPIIGICMGLLLCLTTPFLLWRSRSIIKLLPLAVAGVSALLISSPYTLPLALMKDEVAMGLAFENSPAADHVVAFQQFLANNWGYGGSAPWGKEDSMPFRLGGIWLGFAAIGLVAGRRRTDIRILGAMLVVTVVVMSPLSSPLWKIPPFSMMQFPWRLLSIAVGLQLALLRGWTDIQLLQTRRSHWVGIGLFVFLCGWSPEQFRPKGRLKDAQAQVQSSIASARSSWSTLDAGEFTPNSATARPTSTRGQRSFFAATGTIIQEFQTNPHEPTALVSAEARTKVTLRQSYFPGFQVWVDDVLLSDKELSTNLDSGGLIAFWTSPKEDGHPTFIRASYGHPRGAVLGYLLALLTLLSLQIAPFLEERNSRMSLEPNTAGSKNRPLPIVAQL